MRDGLAAASQGALQTYHLAQPQPPPPVGAYWSETYDIIAREFPMFPLTVEGFGRGHEKIALQITNGKRPKFQFRSLF